MAKYQYDAEGNVTDIIEDGMEVGEEGVGSITVEPEVDPNDFVTTITDDVKKEMERKTAEANLKSGHFYRWPEGAKEAHIRVLPGNIKWGGGGLPFSIATRHWVPKEQGEGVIPVPCLAPKGVGCPLCDLANELKHVLPEKEAQRWEAQVQFLYNILDLDAAPPAPGESRKVMIYGAPKGAHDAIRAALDQQWDMLGANGHVMVLKKELKNGNTRYTGTPSPAKHHVPNAALGGLHNLVEAANPKFTLSDALKIAQVARTKFGLKTGAATSALPPMQRRVQVADKNKLAKEI